MNYSHSLKKEIKKDKETSYVAKFDTSHLERKMSRSSGEDKQIKEAIKHFFKQKRWQSPEKHEQRR